MIKVEVIEKFTLKKFKELENLKRAKKEYEDAKYDGQLIQKDTFECSKEMADYLTGNNPLKKVVVKVIEVIPEAKIEYNDEVLEETPKATLKHEKKSKKKNK